MNKLTLILTSFNRSSLLIEMISSLELQSDKNFDLIICDNHSTDGSWQYIESVVKFNSGEYVKLCWDDNKGWAGSAERWKNYIKTDWVTIICDDDWLGIDFVKTINETINYKSFDFSGLIVIGHKRINEINKLEINYEYSSRIFDIEKSIEEFYQQNFDVAGISSFVIQSSILKKDFPKYYEGNGFLEDTLIIYRALLSGGAIFTNGIHYYRREHLNNISSSQKNSLYFRLAILRFKRDLKIYFTQFYFNERLTNEILKYNTIDHFMGLLREIILRGMNIKLYNEYVRKTKKIDFKRHCESLCFYPLVLIAILMIDILKYLHKNKIKKL